MNRTEALRIIRAHVAEGIPAFDEAFEYLREATDDSIRCGECGEVTNNGETFCNGRICFKRGD